MTDGTDALTRWLLFMVLAGASAGCAPSQARSLARDAGTMQVLIENRAFENATVHAVWPGQRLRLGTVTGHTTAEFTVELATSVLLSFEIDLFAGRDCTTDQIWADPGDIIVLEISPEFVNSASCLD